MSNRLLLTFAALVLAAQNPPAAQAPPTQQPQPPDQQAWRAANRLTDPAERLAALQKLRTEYPQSSIKRQIDTAILTILTNAYPERHEELDRQFDLVLGHIVVSNPPQTRLAATQTAVMILLERVTHKPLLERGTVHGSLDGLDDAIDAVYRSKFPSPVKPQPYVATPARSNRVVLFELFTGASCFPCIAADLALEGVLARYPQDAVAVLAYHGNLPQPDPMVVAANRARAVSYKLSGIPAHFVDGAGKDDGWGDTDRSPEVYRRFTTDIDKALDVPAQAKLASADHGVGGPAGGCGPAPRRAR